LDDSLLEGLDFLLAEMGRRRMRAVIFLTNYWEWSGGMSSYNLWADSASFVDPTTQGWDAYMDSCGGFYARAGAQSLFRDYVRHIVLRENSFTGRLYRDDPTIMAWQLANEPRSGTDSPMAEAQFPAFATWVDETAKFIKSLDPNHLVSTGSEGVMGCLVSEDKFLRIHDTPSVDYLTFHCWPGIWRWFDANWPEATWQAAESLTVSYIRTHIKLARHLHKPLVLEEFGLVRDGRDTRPGSPVFYRDRFVSLVFREILDSASAGAPIIGSNIWAWGGEAFGLPRDLRWKPGYPLLGDPPHEPQGMHAIFNADSSTRRILFEHARRMRELSRLPLRSNEIVLSRAH
jgi:mannan endo-1,4-beta-mannosidase